MAKQKQKRDNPYYLKLLEKQYPEIFADFKAGKYPSVRQALHAAQLKRAQRPINIMKNAWKKASAKEQADFLLWASRSIPPPIFATVIDADRRLLPAAAARVRHIMSQRHLKTGDVMNEMGLKRLNPALGNALAQGTRVRLDLDERLVKWLDRNKAI